MKIEIVTPDEKIFSGDIISVRVPGKKGSFQVLKDHAPVISTLDEGTIFLVGDKNEEISYNITGGVIEVKRNRIIILADSVKKE